MSQDAPKRETPASESAASNRSTARTLVEIGTALSSPIDLVATVAATVRGAPAIGLVAGFQPVDSNVRIDFTAQTPLRWFACVYESGSLSPNAVWRPWVSNEDEFRLVVTSEITLTHGAHGWGVPSYDGDTYTVYAGFGLEVHGVVHPAYTAYCSPNQPGIQTAAVGFELARSNGSERLGSPVDDTLSHWVMELGHSYRLQFNERGIGTLTEQSPPRPGRDPEHRA